MSRAQSWNWEIEFDGNVVPVQKLGEISEGGEEGTIEVVDGTRKYKIGNQIYSIDEVETSVLIKNKSERKDFDLMNDFAKSGKPRDVFAIGRDSTGKAQMTYLFSNCQLLKGKKSGFDRKSKTEETHIFRLCPEDIQEIK